MVLIYEPRISTKNKRRTCEKLTASRGVTKIQPPPHLLRGTVRVSEAFSRVVFIKSFKSIPNSLGETLPCVTLALRPSSASVAFVDELCRLHCSPLLRTHTPNRRMNRELNLERAVSRSLCVMLFVVGFTVGALCRLAAALGSLRLAPRHFEAA